MPTTSFNYNAIKSGIFGGAAPETISGNQFVFLPGSATWSGWITGTDATLRMYMRYGLYTMNVSVDGAPSTLVTATSIGSSNYSVQLFSGAADAPHYVQLRLQSGRVQAFATTDTPNGTTTQYPFEVTGAAPAIEPFGAHATAWAVTDPLFPGTFGGFLGGEDQEAWQANKMYAENDLVTSNGKLYTCATAPVGFSGTTAPDWSVGIASDGKLLWQYSGLVGDIPQIFSYQAGNTQSSAKVPTMCGSPADGTGRVTGDGGTTAVFRGYASEVWAHIPTMRVDTSGYSSRFHMAYGKNGTASSSTINAAPGEDTHPTHTAVAVQSGYSLPSGFTLTYTVDTVKLNWTNAVAAGMYVIPVEVTTALGVYYATFLAVIDPSSTSAPKAGLPNSRALTVGTPAFFKLPFSGTVTSYAAVDPLPAGLNLNTITGLVTGTPTTPGNTQVRVSATNGSGTATAFINFSVTSAGAPKFLRLRRCETKPGAIYAPAAMVGREMVPFVLRMSDSPVSFAVTGGDALPTGLSLNATTGVLSGTPTAGGRFETVITATNPSGSSYATVILYVYTEALFDGGMLNTIDQWQGETAFSADGIYVDEARTRYGSHFNTMRYDGTRSGPTPGAPASDVSLTTPGGWTLLAAGLDPTIPRTFRVTTRGSITGVALRTPNGTASFVPMTVERSVQFGDSVTFGLACPFGEAPAIASHHNIATLNCGIGGEQIAEGQVRVRYAVQGLSARRDEPVNFFLSAEGRNNGGVPAWEPDTVVSANKTCQAGDYIFFLENDVQNTENPGLAIGVDGPRADVGGLTLADGSCWTVQDVRGCSWFPSVACAVPGAPGGLSYYTVGTVVQRNGHVYYCDSQGTSVEGPTGTNSTVGGITETTGTATWHCVSHSVDWAPNTSYTVGTVVRHLGELYRCVTAGRSGSTGPRHEIPFSVPDSGAVQWEVAYAVTSTWAEAAPTFSITSNKYYAVEQGGGLIRYYKTGGSPASATASTRPTFTGTAGTTNQTLDGITWTYWGDSVTNWPAWANNTNYPTVATHIGVRFGTTLYRVTVPGYSAASGTAGPPGTQSSRSFLCDGLFWNNVSKACAGTTGFWRDTSLVVWLPGKRYELNDVVFNKGRAYYCSTAGSSQDLAGAGPTGTDQVNPVSDGTAAWKYTPWTQVAQFAHFNRTIAMSNPKISVVVRVPLVYTYVRNSNPEGSYIRAGIAALGDPKTRFLESTWGRSLPLNWRSDFEAGDYLHPNAEGYAQVGELWKRDAAEIIGRQHQMAMRM